MHQCMEYLHSRDLGRVAFPMERDVDVFPVNYACEGHVVVFRTAAWTRLHQSARTRVTFEVDSWDPAKGLGWSVVLKGEAREVSSGMDPFSRDLRRRPVLPLAPGKRECWIAIFPSEITGRRFQVLPGETR